MERVVGRVAELWRYPVKSMGGDRVTSVRLDARGVHADRLWAVRDVADRRTTSARRLPVLLRCHAAYAEEPGADAGPGRPVPVVVTLPDGEELTGGDPRLDRRLSELCDREVTLVTLPPAGDREGHRGGLVSTRAVRRELGLADDEPLPDASAMPVRTLAGLARWSTPPGMYADIAPVHLLSTRALAALAATVDGPGDDEDEADRPAGSALSPRRFRPTVLLDLDLDPDPDQDGRSGEDRGDERDAPHPERAWVGGRVLLGADAVLPVTMPTVRCVVPGRAQPGLERRAGLGRDLAAFDGRFLGVYADVAEPGVVRVGDEVRVEVHEVGRLRGTLDQVRAAVLRAGARVVD